MDWKSKVAVVTGASSGIGAATSRLLAARGLHVILVARRAHKLIEVRDGIVSNGGSADVIEADLSMETDCLRILQRVNENDEQTEVLVNNAGFGWYGYFDRMPWEIAREMLQVNIMATAHLTSLFLPGMRRQGHGHIINVGSIAGSIPSQGISLYSATKAFQDAFTTALHRETRGTGVHVSVVRAGPVQTEFCASAVQRENGGRVPTERLGVSAEHVAARIWYLLLHPRRVMYVPSWLRITPWIELSFGWLEDRLGPLLLRKTNTTR
jgi:short-subunit dehydrogenase